MPYEPPPPNERNFVLTKDFLKALHEAGLLPQYPWCSRVVIDANIGQGGGGMVQMYVDQIPSGALLNIAPMLKPLMENDPDVPPVDVG